MSAMDHERPPRLLQICREPLKPGREAEYNAIEDETARACADLKCPHPHLALQSLTAPKEGWWLNTFDSEADRDRVTQDYAANRPLMAVLERNGRRTASPTGTPVDIVVTCRADLSEGVQWTVAGARFFVVTATRRSRSSAGTVFEADAGVRFILRAARTLAQAQTLAAAAGPETMVLAVQPSWGMPAREWVAADSDFRRSNPSASAAPPSGQRTA